jgi:DNA polymerase/3'-5' exonuclease PolX
MFQLTQEVRLLADTGEPDRSEAPRQPSNQEMAEVLFNVATLLQMQNANPYRIEAYRNAARNLLMLPEAVVATLARNEVLEMPGLGARLRRKISELATTGHMTFYDDLCEESLPEDVRALMRVRHIGPRTALRLADHLDIHSVDQLWRAAEAQQLRQHHGFGARSERRLAEAAHAVLAERAHAA